MSPPSAEVGRAPHVALLPSAGMGHLTPFLRLATVLAARGCDVTLVTPYPAVSAAESRHVADFLPAASPRVRHLEFRLLPFDSASAASKDPFFLQFEAIRRSAHLLGPLLAAASPAVSAIVIDIPIVSAVAPVVAAVGLPSYVLFTASAAMLALCAAFPHVAHGGAAVGTLEVPGVAALPIGWLPQPLRDPGNLFTTQFVENGRALAQVDGILVNTWEALEGDTLAALNSGTVAPHLPPVTAVGPLPPVEPYRSPCLPWLDAQPERSVVYVSFGSRTALSAEQMREVAVGLESSGCRFLWVVKSKKVDKEDEGVALGELLGEGYMGRVEGRGLLVKEWVDQDAVLSHRAVGGFVSHCGWNSVTEAALRGVRVLGWPRLGDQRINARVVETGGLGAWARQWSWEGEAEVVRGEEIGLRVRELMGNPGVGEAAARVREEAVAAAGDRGSSSKALEELIAKWTGWHRSDTDHGGTSGEGRAPSNWQGL